MSPASEEMLAPAEEVEELQTEEIVSAAVVEELPPSPVPVQEPVPCTTPVEKKKTTARDWLATEGDALSHHLTIGPHGGIDWVCFDFEFLFKFLMIASASSISSSKFYILH